jgi:uncharacterized phage protein (TIGR02218 family)
MPAWLEPDLITLAFCWRLDRRDGVTLGFTSHDQDLIIDQLIYRAAPGMVPSSVERSVALDPDTVELGGILTSESLSEADLAAGRWDGARLTLFAVDWTGTGGEVVTGDTVPLIRGSLGAVATMGGEFQAELRGPTTVLDAAVIEMTSPDCRAAFGDPRCRVDLAGRTVMVPVASSAGESVTLTQPVAADLYAFGRLRWLSGANAGASTVILSNSTTLITLADAPSFAVLPGDRAELTQGCDRRLSTCRDRFANAVNFQGEPHLPGNDLLTRYVS